jgi:hypothetical protein
MLSISLPLPWTLESAWLLAQLAVQVSFVTLIVYAIVMFVGLLIVRSIR